MHGNWGPGDQRHFVSGRGVRGKIAGNANRFPCEDSASHADAVDESDLTTCGDLAPFHGVSTMELNDTLCRPS